MSARLAILASGSGSNAAAIIDRVRLYDSDVTISCVITDRPAAGVIDRARSRGVKVIVVPRRIGRVEHEHRLVATLRAAGTDAVALAGYMRICGPEFLAAYGGRTINVHPSLLPQFPGRDAIGQALDTHADGSGVTVHFIDAGIDTGPLVCQSAVTWPAGSNRAEVEHRLHAVEHALYPLCAVALARGELAEENGFVYASPRLAQQLAEQAVEVAQPVLQFPGSDQALQQSSDKEAVTP